MRIVGTRENCKRACERLRPEGLKWRAHGAKRSAQPRNTGPLKAARCEGAERPCRIVDTERSEVRRGETPGRRRRHGAKSEAAKRLKPRGHGAKRSPQGRNTGRRRRHGAKMQDDYCELWIACSPPPHSLMRVLQWKIHIFRFRPANPQSALRHPGRQSAFSSRAPGSKRWWAAR